MVEDPQYCSWFSGTSRMLALGVELKETHLNMPIRQSVEPGVFVVNPCS